MNSSLVPVTSIELGGRERTMRLDLNAFSDFESITGKSILRGGLSDLSSLEVSDIRALLWACLVQDDESITLRDVGRMIDMSNLSKVVTTITDMVEKALPEEEGEPGPLSETSSALESGGLDSGQMQSSISD